MGRRLNPQPNNYGFILFSLLHAILLIGDGPWVFDRREHRKDFRLRLNQTLQEIVWAKFDVSLSKVLSNDSAQRVISDDFNKVWGLTRMLSDSIDEAAEDKQAPRRTIEFPTEHLKEDVPERPWEEKSRKEHMRRIFGTS